MAKKMHLFIEIKTPFTAVKALADVLQNLEPCVDYHLISLDFKIFSTLHLFPKNAFLLVPTHHNVNAYCNLSLEHQYGGVLGHYLLLNNRKIKELKTANQMVGVGFVDSKYSLYRELKTRYSLYFYESGHRSKPIPASLEIN